MQSSHTEIFSLKQGRSLAGWLRGLEHRLVHQKVVASPPSQDIYLGCGFDPQSRASGRQLVGVDHLNVSPFLSKINKNVLRGGFFKKKGETSSHLR